MNIRAGFSRSFLRSWTSAAPSAPSTILWSHELERFIILRMTIDPALATGISLALWTPRIPTSGWLMIGVAPSPPSLPRLVMVKVALVRMQMVLVNLIQWASKKGARWSVQMVERSPRGRRQAGARGCYGLMWRTTRTMGSDGCRAMELALGRADAMAWHKSA